MPAAGGAPQLGLDTDRAGRAPYGPVRHPCRRAGRATPARGHRRRPRSGDLHVPAGHPRAGAPAAVRRAHRAAGGVPDRPGGAPDLRVRGRRPAHRTEPRRPAAGARSAREPSRWRPRSWRRRSGRWTPPGRAPRCRWGLPTRARSARPPRRPRTKPTWAPDSAPAAAASSTAGNDRCTAAVALVVQNSPAVNSSESPGRKKPISNPVSANRTRNTPGRAEAGQPGRGTQRVHQRDRLPCPRTPGATTTSMQYFYTNVD
jgi:hypothetical protein